MNPGLNPRGAKHERPPGLGSRLPKLGSPIGYVILLILGFMLFRNVFQGAGVRKVSYSDFKEGVRQIGRAHV